MVHLVRDSKCYLVAVVCSYVVEAVVAAPSGVVSDVVGVDVRRQGIIAGHERFQHLLLLQFCFVLFLLL